MALSNRHSGVAEPAQNRILDRGYLARHRVLVHSLAALSMKAQLATRARLFDGHLKSSQLFGASYFVQSVRGIKFPFCM
jgi:hypothetical protein